jgi:hypothetical protein
MVYELPLPATLVEMTTLPEAVMTFAEEVAADDAPAGLKTDADNEADERGDADADAEAEAEADETDDAEPDARPEPA